jgi:2-polyprenyl-3-methyl-5-hydroxy-6-metoxy-1,4-benzoquinol methylase
MTEYWRQHFTRQHADAELGDAKKLDFSNDRVRVQTYGWIVEAIGPVSGIRCLDAGCGTGELARILRNLGGEVAAFDLAEPAIDRLTRDIPDIRWFAADVMQLDHSADLGTFEVVTASEVLQYVDVATALAVLWRRVAPGGRLVAIIPNARCPIISRARERFAGHYNGATVDDVRNMVAGLPEVALFRWRGARFSGDQRIAPYEIGSWGDGSEQDEVPPNRLQVALIRER